MAKGTLTVGEIALSLKAKTEAFNKGLDDAEKQADKSTARIRTALNRLANANKPLKDIGDAGHHAVTGTQAASAAIRTFEGSLPIRAVEQFIAKTLGMGAALKAAFPLIGAIALLGTLGEMGKKAYELYTEFQEGPKKLAEGFRALNEPLAVANDQLRVANDQLEIAIAKAKGKPGNGLKLALDEARLAADQLDESITKANKDTEKLLKDSNVSWWQQLFGRAGNSNITDAFVGKGGKNGFLDESSQIADDYAQKIASATTQEQAHNLQVEEATKLHENYRKQLEWINGELAKRNTLQQQYQSYDQRALNSLNLTGYGSSNLAKVGPKGSDQGYNLEELRSMRRHVQLQDDQLDLTQQHGTLEGQHGALKADEVIDPVKNKINELMAALRASQLAADAAGQAVADPYAKAAGEAGKIIAALNNELAKHHGALTLGQQLYIRSIENTIELNKAEEEWKNKLAASESSIQDRIHSQELLTAAVGKGAAALRQASVETQLMQTLGARYNDPKWMQAHAGDVSGLRTQLGQSYDAQQADQSAQHVDSLNTETEATKRLAAAQRDGAEAVRQVALENQILEMREKGATEAEIAAVRAHDAAVRANQSAGNLNSLLQEIDATHRLIAAQVQGAAAVRQAEVENRALAMQRAGATAAEIQAMREQAKAARDLQVVTEVGQRVNSLGDRISDLKQQLDLLRQMQQVEGDTLQIRIALKETTAELTKAIDEQTLAVGNGLDGLRVFYREMVQEGKSAAQEVYDAMAAAYTGINDQLARLISGQKASWASLFQGISQQLAKAGLERGEQALAKGLGGLFNQGGQAQGQGGAWNEKSGLSGALGGLFGGLAGGGKRDGSSESNALYVTVVSDGGTGGGNLLGQLANSDDDGDDDSGAGGSAIGSLFKGLFGGFRAAGGGVDPGKTYMVGEEGPELWTPPSKGTIIPNGKLGGTTVMYSIDARGADAAAIEQRVNKALIAVHGSAVKHSAAVQAEMAKRKPKGTY